MINKIKKLVIVVAAAGSIVSCTTASEDRSKWNITKDFMMIIGKYFKTNKDFINVMKVNKKYEDLVLMYKMNPISDPSLFENMQTQHFYKPKDVNNRKEGLYQYIHWYETQFNEIANNEIYKNVITNLEDMQKGGITQNGICRFPDNVIKIEKEPTRYEDRFTEMPLCAQNVTAIILPYRLKTINDFAFRESRITELDIPESVTSIGYGGLLGCDNLTKVTLPSHLKNIGGLLLADKTNTKGELTTDMLNATFNQKIDHKNILFALLLSAKINTKNIKEIVVPSEIIKLENAIFKSSIFLINVQLPESLIEIGDDSFYLSGIAQINVPTGITRIGENCFKKCWNLTYISLPNTLIEIDDQAFEQTGLNSVEIPGSVIKIGKYCFYECDKLSSITFLPSQWLEIGNGAFGGGNKAPLIKLPMNSRNTISKHFEQYKYMQPKYQFLDSPSGSVTDIPTIPTETRATDGLPKTLTSSSDTKSDSSDSDCQEEWADDEA